MNLVEQQNMLRELSDGQLTEAMNSGVAPQYLVVAEAKRREDARKRYAALKQKYDASQGTIAEQVLGGLGQSMMGMMGGAPSGMPQGGPPGGLDAAMPPQMPQGGPPGGLDAAMPPDAGPQGFARGGAVHRYATPGPVNSLVPPGKMSDLIKAGMLSSTPIGGQPASFTPIEQPLSAMDQALTPLSNVADVDPYADLRKLYAQQLEGIQKERDRAGALALISAGVGIAGGKSQNVARNLAGAQDAIKGYQDAMTNLDTREGNLLTNKAQLEIEAQRQLLGGTGQDGEVYGTTVNYAKDADGNMHAYVIGNKGSIKEIPLPEGQMMLDPQDVATLKAAGAAEGAVFNTANFNKERAVQFSYNQKHQDMMTNLDMLEQYVSTLPVNGVYSMFTLPGSPQYDVRALIDSVLGQKALSELQAMRENSPTGGAMGNVTDRDMSLLQNAGIALSQGLSRDLFLAQLKRLRGQLEASKAFADDEFNRVWSDFIAGAEPPQAPTTSDGTSDINITMPEAGSSSTGIKTGIFSGGQ